jgi:ketosteroid isomerase-like protein
MPRENVEIIRQMNVAFNRGDVEGVLAFMSDDVEIEDLLNAPDMPAVSSGKEEVRAVFEAWLDAFDEFRGEIEEFFDVDAEHVGCVVHYSGKERQTGIATDFTGVDMWELRDGQVVRATLSHRDRQSALDSLRDKP